MSKKHGKKASVKYRKVTLEHKNLGRKVNQKYFQFLVLILLVVVALSGGTYAFLTSTKNGTKETEIVAGTLKVDYKDKNEINLTNTYPMSDSQGMNTGSYEFTITNEGTVQGKYEISLEDGVPILYYTPKIENDFLRFEKIAF